MPLPAFDQLEVWLITGSQHLYGPEVLKQVQAHSDEIAAALNAAEQIPLRVVCKPVLTSPEEIREVVQQANSASQCVGLVAWMHTFSPAKMWIGGLNILQKPLAHLHSQFNREIPWSTIDMDFMNLNQSAHGGREFGYIATRMKVPRKVVVGHWQDGDVHQELGVWSRAATAAHDLRTARIARIGDNMREVAVTEGDKVAAQIAFGCAVNGYGLGDLVLHVDEVTSSAVDDLCAEYDDSYQVAKDLQSGGSRRESLREAARIEIGLRSFLTAGDFVAFTDNFENLTGLKQLPGLAVQRLMHDGYGFGAEGDWKAAMMVRVAKVMAAGLPGGTSFMEDYTYHLDSQNGLVLGAHMLEICPSIASSQPSCEIHPLGIGGKEDPVRLVFDTPPGAAVNASLVDLGDRFRLILNEVEVVEPLEALPRLPVARAVWKPQPNLKTAAAAWIYAGGSHHPVFSQAIGAEHFEDFAEMTGQECVVIDAETRLRSFKQSLRRN